MADVDVQVRIPGPQALFALIGGPGGPLMRAMLTIGYRVEARAKQLTNNQMVGVVTGRLSGSITTVPAVVDGAPAVLVGTPVEYARYVHAGTKPHWPPKDPIARWLQFKGGNPADAFRVQRAIARRGTPPKPFLSQALADIVGAG